MPLSASRRPAPARPILRGLLALGLVAPGLLLPPRQVLALQQPVGTLAADVATVVAGIDRDDFAWRVGLLAHDSLRGRATPSPGLEAAAAWIAAELGRFRLTPGGDDGSYVQRYPLRTTSGATTGGDTSAPNVVGILEGADPALRSEYVVLSAHFDHLGLGVPDARGDSIYNGADDNASGTAGVLEVAEALASLAIPPRRSVLVVLFSGEEGGLWGSEHFVENPPVPIGRMVADLNVDMIGRNWRDTIAVIGREHSDLGDTVDRVGRAHPALGLTPSGDLWPAERFYFRSDHYNFARKGVPAVFFFNGTHADYHRPSDSPDRIDAEKGARVARLLFHVTLELANAPRRPRWNPDSYRRIVQPGGRR